MATKWERDVSSIIHTERHQVHFELQLATCTWSVNLPLVMLDDFQFDGLDSLRGNSLPGLISCYLFSKLNFFWKIFYTALMWLDFFFLGSQGEVLDHFHNKINISDSPLLLCNENSHALKVRKLGFQSSFLFVAFQPLRFPSVSSQGLVCRAFTILSFYSIFKNPIWAPSIRELRQDYLGGIANTTTQATRTAIESLFKKKKFPGAASVSSAIDLLLWIFVYFPVKRITGVWLRDWIQCKGFLQFQPQILALQC